MSIQSYMYKTVLAENAVAKSGARLRCMANIGTLINIALFIIAAVGASGAISGITMGGLAIGLGGGSFLLKLAGGKLKERKITLLMNGILALFPIVLGALGIANILTGAQVGGGIVGTNLTELAISCCIGSKIGFNAVRQIVAGNTEIRSHR